MGDVQVGYLPTFLQNLKQIFPTFVRRWPPGAQGGLGWRSESSSGCAWPTAVVVHVICIHVYIYANSYIYIYNHMTMCIYIYTYIRTFTYIYIYILKYVFIVSDVLNSPMFTLQWFRLTWNPLPTWTLQALKTLLWQHSI